MNGNIAAGATRFGRRMAEAQMISRCIIRKQVGKTETGIVATPIFTTVYEGPCKVQFSNIQPSTRTPPGQVITTQRLELHVPITADRVSTDCVAEIVDNPLDPTMNGTSFRVLSTNHKTYATARRYPIEEVS